MNPDDEKESRDGCNRPDLCKETQSENQAAREVDTSTAPKRSTQKSRILAAFQKGRTLTHLDAQCEFSASRLSAVVLVLRRAGFPIVTTRKVVLCSDGHRARIGFYHLPKAGSL